MRAEPPVLDYGESTYEKDFWPGRDYEDAADRHALRRLLPATGARLLEIGAGYGRLANLYAGYEQVILLDYSPNLLRDARLRLAINPPLTVAASFYDMPFADGALDVAVMVRVLHHAADVPAVLQEIRRILRPGGLLILEHANKRHFKAVLRYALRRGPNPHTDEPLEFARLNYDFHPAYVRRHLAAAGFTVEQERAVSTFRLPLFKRIFSPTLLGRFDAALQRPLSPLRLSPSIYLRCRANGTPPDPLVQRPLFRCPHCSSVRLEPAGPSLACRDCGAAWSCADGIYSFR